MELRQDYRSLHSPIAIAAYVAIAAVWMTSVPILAARDPALALPAQLALLLFTAAFMGVLWPGENLRRYWGCVGLMLAASFGLLLLGPSGSSFILLVLLAAVLAAHLERGELVAAVSVINLGLLALMHWHWGWGWRQAVTAVLSMASFQAFSALLMRYASRAEAMAAALQASNADLLATRSLLAESARDAERLRLSRELHDVAGHKLTALKLNLAALTRDPRWQDEGRLSLCAQLADELLADIRGVVRQLRRDDGLDLSRAIGALAAPFPRPRVELDIASDARAASVEQAEALLRAVQEALTNSARHSQAQHLWVVLRREQDQLRLDLRDDGRGHGELQPGTGLTGMRERLEAVGGGLAWSRSGTGGVHLQAWLPLLP